MVLVIIINIILKISVTEWAIVMLTIGSVLITETFNTCMEWLIDYVKPDIHPTAKRIKDVAAGGVLIATIISVIIGFLIYLPKIISFFYQSQLVGCDFFIMPALIFDSSL